METLAAPPADAMASTNASTVKRSPNPGEELVSPSAQLRITPLGAIELLSTHDQVLGGPAGQTCCGCRFPADRGYGPAIMREAATITTIAVLDEEAGALLQEQPEAT